MTKSLINIFIWIIVLILGSILTFSSYNSVFAVKNVNPTTYSFEVKKGENIRDIANNLEQKGYINDKNGIIFQNQFNPVDNLQVGSYNLKLPASPADILQQISVQSSEIKNKNKKIESVDVLIKEGENIEKIATTLEQKLNINKTEFLNYVQPFRPELKTKFKFLPDDLGCKYGNIDVCIKYYLEGYLQPDTYNFEKGAKVENIVDKLLQNFDQRIYKKIEGKNLNGLNLNQIISLSSLIEKETGRPIEGVNSSNIEQLNLERRQVASTFLNRIAQNMKLGSDPTIGYWANRTVCQQTLKIENCLSVNDPLTKHNLNTYNNFGIPIGPISNVQYDVVLALIESPKTDNLFFVSDKWGRKYFAKNFSEHTENINKVKQLNQQPKID
jgi:UPF0755 protein